VLGVSEKIVAVQVELSPFSLDIRKNGIAKELARGKWVYRFSVFNSFFLPIVQQGGICRAYISEFGND